MTAAPPTPLALTIQCSTPLPPRRRQSRMKLPWSPTISLLRVEEEPKSSDYLPLQKERQGVGTKGRCIGTWKMSEKQAAINAQKKGETLDDTSKGEDVRMSNIVAAKGSVRIRLCDFPSCRRCHPNESRSSWYG